MGEKDPSSSFRVFTGAYQLSSSSLFEESGSGDPKDSVDSFYTWLDILHKGLDKKEDVGIPNKYIDSAKALLDGFFPLPVGSRPRKRAMIRMNSDDATGEAVTEGLAPITVDLGTALVQIADGPGALAYILSVATPQISPPEPSAFVNEWVIPLLAVLSRCIYLAYLYDDIVGTKPTDTSRPDLTSVPLMSCAMWFIGPVGQKTYYMLGSTYVTGTNAAENEVSDTQKTRLMNIWRRVDLIDTQLATFNPVRTLPPQNSFYFISPTLQEEVEKLLLRTLRSERLSNASREYLNMKLPPTVKPLSTDEATMWNTMVNDAVKDAVADAEKTLRGTYVEACKKANKPYWFDSIDRNQILNNKEITARGDLRSALSNALDVIWSLKGVPPQSNDAESIRILNKAFREVFSVYFVPHFYEIAPKSKGKKFSSWEEIAIKGRDDVTTTLFNKLWPSTAKKILLMAFRIYYWVMAEDDSLDTAGGRCSRWGRCSETHPSCGLMFPGIADRQLLSEDNPSKVEGIAMEIRNFNNRVAGGQTGTFDLAKTLSWETLAQLHKDRGNGLFRLPCANCQLLLPALDIRTGQKYYDVELYSKFPNFDQEEEEKRKKKNETRKDKAKQTKADS
ncbi:hypothetical protein F53441_3597 [Fusarium austroafricanum]|uniref:Uncharacterized protein n=1 Tax=Fusarium austroafricanum TaxID=2364996 RepID=A0A8H4KNT5_9HYPO|nr:hypothetical protein F53441_3597 [Fusarium austroafricanum]